MKHYDVIIVGSGPAGIFAAMELLRQAPSVKILIVEKGRDISRRHCPMLDKKIPCVSCAECSIVSGWGGAGAFSDGKLSLSPSVGGFLHRYMSQNDLLSLIDYVDGIYIKYGAPRKTYGEDTEKIKALKRKAAASDLEFIPSRIRHIGTDRCLRVLKKMQTYVTSKATVLFNRHAASLTFAKKGRNKRALTGVAMEDGEAFTADTVILAPGREGSKWLEQLTRTLGLPTLRNPVDIGVRVELPAPVLEPLTQATYEPKLVYNSRTFDDRVRTFCVNPYGEVVKEYLKGIWTVNGHSYTDRRTDNTNFALLVSSTFTAPFDEPIAYGRYIAGLANFLGGGAIVQRLGDLRAGRRSTPQRMAKGLVRPTLKDATPGDLSFVLPYRYLTGILEMLEALDRIAPGVNSRHTLLYGIEVKFYSMQLKLSNCLETEIENLFAIGDGAGVSRGLIQASASGVVAAREIAARLKNH